MDLLPEDQEVSAHLLPEVLVFGANLRKVGADFRSEGFHVSAEFRSEGVHVSAEFRSEGVHVSAEFRSEGIQVSADFRSEGVHVGAKLGAQALVIGARVAPKRKQQPNNGGAYGEDSDEFRGQGRLQSVDVCRRAARLVKSITRGVGRYPASGRGCEQSAWGVGSVQWLVRRWLGVVGRVRMGRVERVEKLDGE